MTTSTQSRPVTRRTQIAMGTPTRRRMGKGIVVLGCVAVALGVAAAILFTQS